MLLETFWLELAAESCDHLLAMATSDKQVAPQSYGHSLESLPESGLRSITSLSSDVQSRMPPGMSLVLMYMLMVLVVLNVEIVVPTADQYAMRLGASYSFSGLVIALTPFWQGILGVPLNFFMLRRGLSIKSILILMSAFSVLGNVLYALAGLMHSKVIILVARTLIGICQCTLAGPIYIARAVGVKRRTRVFFVYSTMAAVAFFTAPWIASLLSIFVKDLRIEDLVLDSDTIPGWFMAGLYFVYLLLVVFFFEDVPPEPEARSQPAPEPSAEVETFLKPGLLVCLLASFLSPASTTMGIVFFVKLCQKAWLMSVSATGLYLGCAMAFVALTGFASGAVTPYLEDRRGLLLSCCCACVSAVLMFAEPEELSMKVVFLIGFLLSQCCAAVVKNYGHALAPQIVAPCFKDRAGTCRVIATQLGRGFGAQLGAIMSSTSYAATQVGSYLLLALLVLTASKQLQRHSKAM